MAFNFNTTSRKTQKITRLMELQATLVRESEMWAENARQPEVQDWYESMYRNAKHDIAHIDAQLQTLLFGE